MSTKLKQIGKYFELPIIGCKVSACIFHGRICLKFNDKESSTLDIDGEFRMIQFGQEKIFDPTSKESWVSMLDLFGAEVKSAKADAKGWLYVEFDNKNEIVIEDGPFENWHFTKKYENKDPLYVHGGIGRTTF